MREKTEVESEKEREGERDTVYEVCVHVVITCFGLVCMLVCTSHVE